MGSMSWIPNSPFAQSPKPDALIRPVRFSNHQTEEFADPKGGVSMNDQEPRHVNGADQPINVADHPSEKKTRRPTEQKPQRLATSRRGFLKTAGLGAAALTAGGVLPTILVKKAQAVEISPFVNNPGSRASALANLRANLGQAAGNALVASEPHPTNGDEETYANSHFEGNFSKTMPLDKNGLPARKDYQLVLAAAAAGTQAAWDAVPAGGTGTFAGPLSPLVFQIEGSDSPTGGNSKAVVPPSINSAAGAAEQVELYWEAYLRDVPFIQYASNPLVAQAVADMNKLSAFAGPTPVTPQNLFRYGPGSIFSNPNAWFGADVGPYVSQLLYRSMRLDGADYVPLIHTHAQVSDPNTGQVLTTAGSGVDFLTNLTEYLTVETGNGAVSPTIMDPTPRFVRSVRDLGNLAASDSIYSLYFRASLILSALGVPFSASSPYATDTRISPFSTFSTSWLNGLLGNVHKAEASAFYGKWYVHRKLRPEQFGNLVDGVMSSRIKLTPNLHPDLLNSAVLPLIFTYNQQLNAKRGMGTAGSFLLPQELNGGSPSHPDTPAGHAYTAGACVTLLKAGFDVGTPSSPRPWPITPVQASADGLSLPTTSDKLTVLGELNKLAVNIAEGRNMSGIHTRIGGDMLGLTWGEQVAISVLTEHAMTYPESFSGFSLTKFDGTTITVGGNQ